MYRNSYYTNFLVNTETNKVIMALDYDSALQSLRGALQFDGIDGVKVERVGPLSDGPIFETPSDYEPVINRIQY